MDLSFRYRLSRMHIVDELFGYLIVLKLLRA